MRKFIRPALIAALGSLLTPQALAQDVEFDFSGSWRMRYETLKNPIFPATEAQRTQSNDRISSRVLLKGEANYGNWNATLEIQDSRAFLDDNDPTLKSSQVNTLEPLQYFIRYKDFNEYVKAITVGRMAVDHGSRRLMAKGVYRNAINAFDGVMVDTVVKDWDVRGFYFLPVSRFPTQSQLVEDNKRAFDKSFSERKYFGLYAVSPDEKWKIQNVWFKESDSEELATKNRDLYTLSVDYSESFAGDWKSNIEVIGQTGTARASSSASDLTDLDVNAWMVHAHLGQQVTKSTFLRAEIDFATGDNDSADDEINAFDGLYGVRRFDFGPTDVYQGFQRSNIIAPGLRSVTKIGGVHNIMVGYKALWYHKVEQGEEDFMGNQLEVRWRYQVMPELRLEFGGAYLMKGGALEQGDYPDDSQFAYTAFLYKF